MRSRFVFTLVLLWLVSACGGIEASVSDFGDDNRLDPKSGFSPGPGGPGGDSGFTTGEQDAGAADEPDAALPDEPDAGGCVPQTENCHNWVDDDCDGLADSSDPDCMCEPSAEDCGNGYDDDCDGLVDGDDPDCQCQPSAEDCGNGVDDDCDGLVDSDDPDCGCDPAVETCEFVCEDYEGGNCNADLGYGDHCAPSDNTHGCSDSKFWAWCNRRNTAYGCNDGSDSDCIWYEFLRDWVDQRCDGSVETRDVDGNGYDEFVCTGSDGRTYQCTTPIVLQFDTSRPVGYHHDDGMAAFDLAAPDRAPITRTDWPTAATPWLAMDRDGDGQISSGQELFGSASPLADGTARHGFEALAALDDNGDGALDRRDADFARLLVWADLDGDRRSAACELFTLGELGVSSLSLDFALAPRCDARGNCERERASFTWTDAVGERRVGAAVDVHLRVRGPSGLML